MIYKRCTNCGKRIDYNSVCSCKNSHKDSNIYKKDDEKKFYSSKRWQNLVEITRNKFHHLDIYSLYERDIIEKGQVVHHIIPIDDDFEKRFSLDNLIFLTEKNHRHLHNLMKKDGLTKKNVQEILFSLIDRFENEFKGGGGIEKI